MLEKTLRAGIIVENTSAGVPQGGLVNKITDYINYYKLDILLGPEWLFLPDKRLYTKAEKERTIGRIAENTKDRDTLIIPGSILWEDGDLFYNTAPLISKGQLIGEYHKFYDGGDAGKAKDKGCVKKKHAERVKEIFSWKGYRIGLEICADSGLLNEHMGKSNDPLLDLYFLVSCGLTLHELSRLPVDIGGYGLCADGSGPECMVFKKKENQNNKAVKSRKVSKQFHIYRLKMGYNKDQEKEGLFDKLIFFYRGK